MHLACSPPSGKDSCNALGPEPPPLVPPPPRGVLHGAAGGAQGPREEAGWGARPGAFRGCAGGCEWGESQRRGTDAGCAGQAAGLHPWLHRASLGTA